MEASRKSTRISKPPRRPLDDAYTWDSLGSLSADFAKMSTDLAHLARFPSPTLPAQSDPPTSQNNPPSASPLDHSRPTIAASPPLAREAAFVTSSESQIRVNTASNEPTQDQESTYSPIIRTAFRKLWWFFLPFLSVFINIFFLFIFLQRLGLYITLSSFGEYSFFLPINFVHFGPNVVRLFSLPSCVALFKNNSIAMLNFCAGKGI